MRVVVNRGRTTEPGCVELGNRASCAGARTVGREGVLPTKRARDRSSGEWRKETPAVLDEREERKVSGRSLDMTRCFGRTDPDLTFPGIGESGKQVREQAQRVETIFLREQP